MLGLERTFTLFSFATAATGIGVGGSGVGDGKRTIVGTAVGRIATARVGVAVALKTIGAIKL